MSEKKLLKFKNKKVVPPGGYKYEIPDSDAVIEGATLNDLITRVTKYLAANEQRMPYNLPDIIEDWICQRIPPDMTDTEHLAKRHKDRALSLSAVQEATRLALHEWRAQGRHCVSWVEAVGRAGICKACDFNTSSTACFSCIGLKPWVKQWLGRATPLDGDLHVCRVSAIMNIAQVHLLARVFADISHGNILEKHPLSCWKRKFSKENNNGT